MEIKFECPFCGQRISSPIEQIAAKGVCPSCNSEIIVPGQSPPTVVAKAPNTSKLSASRLVILLVVGLTTSIGLMIVASRFLRPVATSPNSISVASASTPTLLRTQGDASLASRPPPERLATPSRISSIPHERTQKQPKSPEEHYYEMGRFIFGSHTTNEEIDRLMKRACGGSPPLEFSERERILLQVSSTAHVVNMTPRAMVDYVQHFSELNSYEGKR